MSLLDLVADFADVLVAGRIAAAIGLGLLGAIAAHALLDDPFATRVAVLGTAAGLVAGIAREYRHRHSHDA